MTKNMNILHLKYAVEVAKHGSLSKASETLLTAQPNISRSVKELEGDLGIQIFERTPKGMVLTPDGEEFISYATLILKEIDQVELMYKQKAIRKRRFSVSVPRASYISEAMAAFSKELGDGTVEIFYKETNSQRTINNVLGGEYSLGIIRYAEGYDHYFKAMLEEKELAYETVTEFTYKLLMSERSPLAKRDEISLAELSDRIEIAHADPYVPSLPLSRVVKEELADNVRQRIFIFERASQFDILSENENSFMWVSPVPELTLKRYGLVQRDCAENKKLYKDVLIYKKNYRLTELDKSFITALCNSKRRNF